MRGCCLSARTIAATNSGRRSNPAPTKPTRAAHALPTLSSRAVETRETLLARFDAVTERELRSRKSAKWRHYPSDVLPAWVAEMDLPLAEPIKRVLSEALEADDTGYAYPEGVGEAFLAFSERRYGYTFAPRDVKVAPDVVTAITEILHVSTEPGDPVVIDPPVYPPFAGTVRTLERKLLEAPLVRHGERFVLDLDAIRRAYAAGARVHVLCSPHNPTGTVHDAASLTALAELADAHGVLVIADEIHAPLTLEGATHRPFVSLGDAAARRGIVLQSASKAWNLAGLKAAVMLAVHDETRAVLARLPPELPYHAGHFGVLATKAAFLDGETWLDAVRAHLDRNRRRLGELLGARVPRVRYRAPEAGYLAWLDFRELGLGADPAKRILERGRLALSPGPTFGTGGEGFARLNFATSEALLIEAVARIARAVEG